MFLGARVKRSILLMFLITVATATGLAPVSAAPKIRGVEFRLLEKADGGPFRNSFFRVVHTAKEWSAWMSDLEMSRGLIAGPAPRPPDIDWKTESVLVGSVGWRPTGGFRFRIVGLYRLGSELRVEFEYSAPGGGALNNRPSAPVEIIAFSSRGRTNLDVEAIHIGPETASSAEQIAMEIEQLDEQFSTWGALKSAFSEDTSGTISPHLGY